MIIVFFVSPGLFGGAFIARFFLSEKRNMFVTVRNNSFLSIEYVSLVCLTSNFPISLSVRTGVNTYMAMQRLAAKYGYTGAVNGILGPNSYKGLARYFNTL